MSAHKIAFTHMSAHSLWHGVGGMMRDMVCGMVSGMVCGIRVPDFTVHTAVLVTILNQQYCGNSHHTDAIILPR